MTKIPIFLFSNAKHWTKEKIQKKNGGHRVSFFISTVENPKMTKFYIYLRAAEKLVSDTYVLVLCGISSSYQSLEPV